MRRGLELGLQLNMIKYLPVNRNLKRKLTQSSYPTGRNDWSMFELLFFHWYWVRQLFLFSCWNYACLTSVFESVERFYLGITGTGGFRCLTRGPFSKRALMRHCLRHLAAIVGSNFKNLITDTSRSSNIQVLNLTLIIHRAPLRFHYILLHHRGKFFLKNNLPWILRVTWRDGQWTDCRLSLGVTPSSCAYALAQWAMPSSVITRHGKSSYD